MGLEETDPEKAVDGLNPIATGSLMCSTPFTWSSLPAQSKDRCASYGALDHGREPVSPQRRCP